MLPRTRLIWAVVLLLASGCAAAPPDADRPAKVAAIVTVFTPNSHADVIVGRLLPGHTSRGPDEQRHLELASLYVDQTPQNDLSKTLAQAHGFLLADSIDHALTAGGDALVVDGVLLIAEHGDYPRSPTGAVEFPKRRFFEEVVRTFERTGQVVPVFIDKHVATTRDDLAWIMDKSAALDIPLMAGSVLPIAWRQPPIDVERDAKLRQIVAISYGSVEGYGFHALEAVQALAEQRAGGETGVKSVQTLTGDDVWTFLESDRFHRSVFDRAVAALPRRRGGNKPMRDAVRRPVVCIVRYRDGLTACVFTLNGLADEWSAAWQYADGRVESTWFQVPERAPFPHFSLLVDAIEQMIRTGQPTWPAQRTFLTTGVLEAMLQSRHEGGAIIPTPHLDIRYESRWRWSQPAGGP